MSESAIRVMRLSCLIPRENAAAASRASKDTPRAATDQARREGSSRSRPSDVAHRPPQRGRVAPTTLKTPRARRRIPHRRPARACAMRPHSAPTPPQPKPGAALGLRGRAVAAPAGTPAAITATSLRAKVFEAALASPTPTASVACNRCRNRRRRPCADPVGDGPRRRRCGKPSRDHQRLRRPSRRASRGRCRVGGLGPRRPGGSGRLSPREASGASAAASRCSGFPRIAAKPAPARAARQSHPPRRGGAARGPGWGGGHGVSIRGVLRRSRQRRPRIRAAAWPSR